MRTRSLRPSAPCGSRNDPRVVPARAMASAWRRGQVRVLCKHGHPGPPGVV